jgi:hypothetical protein
MAKLIIKLRQLLGWEHPHPHRPLTQRSAVERHLLGEQMCKLISALRGRGHWGMADNRLIQETECLHIVVGFNFHGRASTGRVFPCVATAPHAVPSKSFLNTNLKKLAKAFDALCKPLHKNASIKIIYIYKSYT